MAATEVGRSGGCCRGLGRGWIGSYTPKPCPVNITDLELEYGKFENSEEEEEEEELLNFATETELSYTIDELSDQIAGDILVARQVSNVDNEEKERKIYDESSLDNDEKPVTMPTNTNFENNEYTHKAKDIETNTKNDQYKDVSNVLSKAVNAPEFIGKSTVLLNAVDAAEFFPKRFIPLEEKERKVSVTSIISPPVEGQPPLLRTQSTGDDQIALDVLKDVIMTLMEDPGDFENVVDQLTEHLKHFVTKEETLQKVVNILIEQAIDEPNFKYTAAKLCQHFDVSKALEFESGVSFRKIFFNRCQNEFVGVKTLLEKNELNNMESVVKITNTAMLFGELFCNMKLKDKPIPIYKKVITKIVELFLDNGKEELIVCLTRLLKLVGPEMDIGRPKDAENLFNSVKDFYLDEKKSQHLSQSIRKAIWNVYKLHSRDWDRSSSAPPSPALEPAEMPEYLFPVGAHAPVQVSRKISHNTRSSPVDWGDYYAGDDTEIYSEYIKTGGEYGDEEEDAYEEFLRISGQL